MKRNYKNNEVVDFKGESNYKIENQEEIGCVPVAAILAMIVVLFILGLTL